MPYRDAVAGCSSTLSLVTFSFPSYSPAISSTIGAIDRHGPHHGAQKSTSTGTLLWITSTSKLLSPTSVIFPTMVVSFSNGHKKSQQGAHAKSGPALRTSGNVAVGICGPGDIEMSPGNFFDELL